MQDTKNKMCMRCGSYNFISDRSLGGKIICAQCGSSLLKSRGLSSFRNRNIYFFGIILLVLFLVLII